MARLLQGLASAQGLMDGNKRLAWLACVVFCDLNGVELDGSDDEIVQFVLDIATGVIPDTEAAAARLTSLVKR